MAPHPKNAVFSSGFKRSLLLAQEKRPQTWEWPKREDPRIPFALILTFYCVIGFSFLGFNRSPFQMLTLIVFGCLFDSVFSFFLRGKRLVPLSAYISCCSLGLLLNYSHHSWMLFFPVFMTIASKYIFTFQGKHIYNPSLFGVCTSLFLTNELVTAAPAYQWAGGEFTMSAFVLMLALSLFVFRIGRGWLIVSFLFFYMLQTALRAHLLRHHIPAEMLFIGTLSSPPFFLFTFYMMTDPATSPKTKWGQIGLGFAVALLDLYLHTKESVFTFFYAAFMIATGKFCFLHFRALFRQGLRSYFRSIITWKQVKTCTSIVSFGSLLFCWIWATPDSFTLVDPHFQMESLSAEKTGISGTMSSILTEVDPRVAHIAKWVLSVGDAVAVSDVDQDGLLDIFLTQVLKVPEDRNALYRNKGNFQFERISLPALDPYRTEYKERGLISGATFVDYDGDGDSDLALAVAYGPSRLLKNEFVETGQLSFVDVTNQTIPDEYTVSLAITFFDWNQDAHLDILIANAMSTTLLAYPEPKPRFNLFKLPKPAYSGDRRMFSFMHNGWHNADNGGLNIFYEGGPQGTFTRKNSASLGLEETRWSLSIGTADFNQDGFTDLYIANDFGPDNLYLNESGKHFANIKGRFFGQIGRDTYKGMNCSLADFDRNGTSDIYVSNVHHTLQAEGSLLWMTYPSKNPFQPEFRDEATQRGALNERRFGWGADAGDINNDGWVDIIQANGMVDDRLDPMNYPYKDYFYVNHKLMQSSPEMHTYADMWGDIRGRTLYPNEARRAYLNRGASGKVYFTDVATQIGINDPENSRGVALADLDNDGDLDLIITNQHSSVSIYRNNLRNTEKRTSANFIGLTLIGNGTKTHRSAIGSRVIFRYEQEKNPVEAHDEVSLLSGFSGQGDPRIHLGLGLYSGPVEVTVYWYGGKAEVYRLLANKYHVLEQSK